MIPTKYDAYNEICREIFARGVKAAVREFWITLVGNASPGVVVAAASYHV